MIQLELTIIVSTDCLVLLYKEVGSRTNLLPASNRLPTATLLADEARPGLVCFLVMSEAFSSVLFKRVSKLNRNGTKARRVQDAWMDCFCRRAFV